MPTSRKRGSTRPARRAADASLVRVPRADALARVIPTLAPETLHALVRHRGLDAAVEVFTSATPAQLTALADLDLWRSSQPGDRETFDADRFGEWLETLAAIDESTAARIVASLDTDVVVAGLSLYVRVFDPGIFEPHETSDDEARDRHRLMHSETSRDIVECEVGGYVVRSRRTDAWDAVVGLLATLDAEYQDVFHAVMQGCRRLSNSRPEIDGLDDLLILPEQHLHELSHGRDDRRASRGYVTSADARAFLQAARLATSGGDAAASIGTRQIAGEYFRAARDATDGAAEILPDAIDGLERPRGLLQSRDDVDTDRVPLLRRLMTFVEEHDAAAYQDRSRDLAFLVNALVAGGTVQSRAFTLREAADAAAAVCNLGLERWTTIDGGALADSFLVDHDLIAVFEAGWSALHRDVTLFATNRLIAIVADLHCVDVDTAAGLGALHRELVRDRDAGRPWLARDAADVLATLDQVAWIAVRGLLDECPVVADALTAVLERRTTTVSATAFRFISSTAQIGDIRVFMRALPHVLAR